MTGWRERRRSGGRFHRARLRERQGAERRHRRVDGGRVSAGEEL